MNTMVSQTNKRIISVHNEREFLLKMEKAGLNDELAQKVVESKSNDLATKVVRLIENGGFEPSTSQKRTREIMGWNFFGIEEAIKHFGVNSSRAQTAALSEVPFTEDVLEFCKDTHVLVAVFPISILDIRGKVERKLFDGHEDSWYNKEVFAKDRGEIGWRMVRKTPVPYSISKNWDEQQALLDKNEETPSAQVMAYTIIGHYLATGEHLFENVYVRTSSVDSGGNRVDVGSFDQYGLFVDGWGDDSSYDSLGVSSARKS